MTVMDHPDMDTIELQQVLYALGDLSRLHIVKNLHLNGPLPCKEASCPNMSKSTISHHFKILREAGLLQCEKVGVTHMNSIRSDELNAKFPNLLETVISLIPDIPKD